MVPAEPQAGTPPRRDALLQLPRQRDGVIHGSAPTVATSCRSVRTRHSAGQAWQYSAPRPAVVKVLYFQFRVDIRKRVHISRSGLRCRFGGERRVPQLARRAPHPGALAPPSLAPRPARPRRVLPPNSRHHRSGRRARRPPCPAAGGGARAGVARTAGATRMTLRWRPGTQACRRRRRRGVAATSGGRG